MTPIAGQIVELVRGGRTVDSRLALPVNTVLDGSYRVTRVIGVGGFGITYEAEDINLIAQVAIKEYYPFDFGDRDATMEVRPKSDRHRNTFDWGRSNFLQEARTLARFEHPSIVRVTRVFETNATAYMVMRYERGQSFEAWLFGLGRRPTQDELDTIVAPLLGALEMMHAADFLHRDIAPDNIIVRADGTPVLLDFGSARRAVAEASETMTGIVKAGYSPHEQYSSNNRLQGPWSDIYALGGTLYRAVTGQTPEEATLRFDEDHMPPASQTVGKGRYRPSFLTGIDTCLKMRHADRPQSVAEARALLLDAKALSKLALRTPPSSPPRAVDDPLSVSPAPAANPPTAGVPVPRTRPLPPPPSAWTVVPVRSVPQARPAPLPRTIPPTWAAPRIRPPPSPPPALPPRPRPARHLFTDIAGDVRPPTEKIFISYRREDSSGQAGRVHDRLEREFHRDTLFMDVDAIPLGEDFSKVLADAVAKCGILLAIIGPSWLNARDDEGQRRLEDPRDFVRIEITAALQREIPVIPLLFDGTRMPRPEHLPEEMQSLTFRNGLDVRHRTFHADIDKLVQFLKKRWETPG